MSKLETNNSNTYNFEQFDPRPQGAEKNNGVISAANDGADLLGIEVTIPHLAEKCGLGNLDHHGPTDTADTPSAAEQALVAELPPAGSTLATVRCDADAVTAMAILTSAAEGKKIDADLVGAIGRFDRLGPSAGRPDDRVIAIAAKASDFKSPLPQRVAWVQALLAGEGDAEEVAALVAARDREFEATSSASELSLHADGRIALVVSSHRFATNLGYERATVVVAFNPEFPMNFREPDAGTYAKFTVCRYDSHVPCDVSAALAELNELDPAVTEGSKWGGRGDIGGSPQGCSSGLTPEEVVAVVGKHLK